MSSVSVKFCVQCVSVDIAGYHGVVIVVYHSPEGIPKDEAPHVRIHDILYATLAIIDK